MPKLRFLICLLLALACNVQSADVPLREELDVKYGEANGQPLLLDVFRPANQKSKLPVVVYVHGGGWTGGNKNDFRSGARGLAKADYVTFTIGYRLVRTNDVNNSTRWPGQIDDVQRAIRWIRSKAEEYQLDTNKIGAIGGSAGGHLVNLLGTIETRDNSDKALAKYSSKVQCVVNMFGPTDLTPDFTTNGPAGPAVQTMVDNLIAKPKSTHLATYKEASPLFQVSSNSAAFLHFHGTVDPLVPLDQSQRFHDALKKAGAESTLVIFEGEGHSFVKPENVQKFIKDSVNFFNRHLKGTGSK
jgi:acetyl esterase/lipase